MNNQLNISSDTLTEITQYLKFNDLINIGLTNKENYNNIFVNPSFIILIYNLSLINSNETIKFFEKINKKIFVKKLIIIDKQCKSYSEIKINFLQNILQKYEINFLEILNLQNHFYITNTILEFILKLFDNDKKNNLKELHLTSCRNITGNKVKYLSKLNNLNVLNLTNCRKINKLSFLSELINLKELNLTNCYRIINEELLFLSKLTNLEILNLVNCYRITDNELKYLSKLNKLIKLNLSGCDNITNNGLKYLSELDKLVELNLSGCIDITNNGLKYLSKLNNLVKLNISSCYNINDNGLLHLFH